MSARPPAITPVGGAGAAGAGAAGASLSRGGGLCLAAIVWLAAAQGLAGCREDGAALAGTGGAAVAPAAEAERRGDWLGGPEPVSGKLRSGIVSWWRLVPAQPAAGMPFELLLRLEDVQAADAAVAIAPGDGARLAEAEAPQRWALTMGQPAQIALRLVAPAGDSYLHVTTQQHGRSSVRSIRLAMPLGASPRAAASAPARGDYAVDAQGEPIVRMPSGR